MPGGHLFIEEMHPALIMYEPGENGAPSYLANSYFREEPWVETSGLDYYSGTTYDAQPTYAFPHTLAKIIMAGIGAGLTLRHFGELDIRWNAEDTWMSQAPITLLYSDQPSGPWTTIRSGLPNTGQFYWPVEPRVPKEIYLRIEARDEAGNSGVYQVPKPINTGGLTPEARIRGIRPKHAE